MKTKSLVVLAIAGMVLSSCVAPQTTTQSSSAASSAGQEVLGALLNTAVSSQSVQNAAGGILGNLLSTVTGNTTTTKTNLVGTWTYTTPAVQFESENLLTMAGGTAAASKVEAQLEPLYKKAGIKPGKLIFTFASDGSVKYKVGSIERTGTYTFDNTNKILSINLATSGTLKAYVSIVGTEMSLTFDSSKLLSTIGTICQNSSITSLGTLGTLAQSFDGMKTGFKFSK